MFGYRDRFPGERSMANSKYFIFLRQATLFFSASHGAACFMVIARRFSKLPIAQLGT